MTDSLRIPDVPVKDEDLQQIVTAVQDSLEILKGDKGTGEDRAVVRKDLDQAWTLPILLNSWKRYSQTYEAPAFYKDITGLVRFRGAVASGTINNPIFTLPSGYRPGSREIFVAMSNTGVSQLDVTADGDVIPVSGGTTWFSLSGISYRAA